MTDVTDIEEPETALAPARGSPYGIPMAVLAEITHRCPLQCPYCSNPVELDRPGDELSTAQWKRVLNEMADALARGDTVKISSFGSFFVRQKGQRMGRNPKTGEEVPIHPRKVLVFRASHVLKNRINQVPSDDGGS